MELTVEQEADVQKIMAEIDCPRDFHCCKSGFEHLAPVKVMSDNAVVCPKAREYLCRMATKFGLNSILSIMLCRCPLRRYAALELGR
ncbi:MAG: hypothetical protein AMJ65_08790 [Phycisphaerae bacterium SG8_4]|nr:MAG: hypothetical protein AMJ65_08790 [Phycisphaerae bacterium SG8_4]